MQQDFASYLKNVAINNIDHLLSIHPPMIVNDVISDIVTDAYLTHLGLILAKRFDLIQNHELRAKLGFSERPQWPKQPETTPEQEQIKPEEEGEVTLDPRINVGELRMLLVREILQTTRMSDTDAREFATYLMEMGQFKSTLNISNNEVFVFRKQLFDYLSNPLGEALQRTLRTIHMFEVLQKWVTERTADQATSHKLPVNQLSWEWKQSLNETPVDSIQSPPEVPSKTERANDLRSFSFFKSVVTSPQWGPTERYSKEEAVFRLVEVVGIPSQTANVVAEELLQMFSEEELKKHFESTLEVQRLFWIWVRSKCSFDFFKCLTNLDVYETKVWIHRLLGIKEELQSAINDGLRIQNLSFLDLIYLLIRMDVNGGTNRFLGPLQSLLSKFNFDALLDTWKRGAVVY